MNCLPWAKSIDYLMFFFISAIFQPHTSLTICQNDRVSDCRSSPYSVPVLSGDYDSTGSCRFLVCVLKLGINTSLFGFVLHDFTKLVLIDAPKKCGSVWDSSQPLYIEGREKISFTGDRDSNAPLLVSFN